MGWDADTLFVGQKPTYLNFPRHMGEHNSFHTKHDTLDGGSEKNSVEWWKERWEEGRRIRFYYYWSGLCGLRSSQSVVGSEKMEGEK